MEASGKAKVAGEWKVGVVCPYRGVEAGPAKGSCWVYLSGVPGVISGILSVGRRAEAGVNETRGCC